VRPEGLSKFKKITSYRVDTRAVDAVAVAVAVAVYAVAVPTPLT
jgi:hypothetical protein